MNKISLISIFSLTVLIAACGMTGGGPGPSSNGPGGPIIGSGNGLGTGPGNDINDLSPDNQGLFQFVNVQSGFKLGNVQNGVEKNWKIVPVKTPTEKLVQNPSGWVQIVDPVDTTRCLSSLGGVITFNFIPSSDMDTCSLSNPHTLFTLIPSTTGAVQIKSIPIDGCLNAGSAKVNGFLFGSCISRPDRPETPIPKTSLWMLRPPFSQAGPAPFDGMN